MARTLLPILLLAACVVRSGGTPKGLSPAEPLPPPADFEEVDARLDALLDSAADVDQRDRLLSARDLARQTKTAPPDVQQDVLRYLRQVVSIEERARPIVVPEPESGDELSAFSPLITPVVEEEIEDIDPVGEPPAPDARPNEPVDAPPAEATEWVASEPVVDAADGVPAETASTETPSTQTAPSETAPSEPAQSEPSPLATARASLDAGRPAAALAALEPCRDQACGDDAEPMWEEARDAYVGIERERAGSMWRAAGREPDPKLRAEVLRETRAILAALVDRFPDTVHAADIRRNIEQVQADLGAIEASLEQPPEAGPAPAPDDDSPEAH